MSKLFIIGNGFDLAHKLPTSYGDFKNYLISEYPESQDIIIGMDFSPTQMPDGDLKYDDNEIVSLLVKSISEVNYEDIMWQEFEEYLGALDFREYFDDISSIYHSQSDPNLFHEAYGHEDFGQILLDTVPKIKDFFSDWVKTINQSEIRLKNDFLELINDEDKFINFNYTNTLEESYEIPSDSVWHPHGDLNGVIVVGHGNKKYDGSKTSIGGQDYLNQINYSLIKDTDKIIKNNEDKFESLANITKIYSHGFSFSDVDLPYIEKICNSIDTHNITWYLNDYDNDNKRTKYKAKIRNCGFKGDFSTFNIK